MRIIRVAIVLAIVFTLPGGAALIKTNVTVDIDSARILSETPHRASDFLSKVSAGVNQAPPEVSVQTRFRGLGSEPLYRVDGIICSGRAVRNGSPVKGVKTEFVTEVTVLDNGVPAEYGSGTATVKARTKRSGYASASFPASEFGDIFEPPANADGYTLMADVYAMPGGRKQIDGFELECSLTRYLEPEDEEYLLRLVDDRIWAAARWWLDDTSEDAMPEKVKETKGRFSFAENGMPEITVILDNECKDYDAWALTIFAEREATLLRAGIRYAFEILDRRTGKRETYCNSEGKLPIPNCRRLPNHDGVVFHFNVGALSCP